MDNLHQLEELLKQFTIEELKQVNTVVARHLAQLKDQRKKEIKTHIIEKAQLVNEFGRRIYTNREIAKLLNIKEYLVALTLKNKNKKDA